MSKKGMKYINREEAGVHDKTQLRRVFPQPGEWATVKGRGNALDTSDVGV